MRVLLLFILLTAGTAAQACGYCVEDKVASVYDHALVTQALARKHHVVFFHIDGPLVLRESTKRWLEAEASSIKGVDSGSTRVAVETLTMAIGFDPQRTSLIKLQNALDRKLSVKNLSLMPLRVIEQSAGLKPIARR